MSFHNRKLNWQPGLKSEDDQFHVHKAVALTPVDLRQFCPPVYDQGHEGSCPANAVTGVFELKEKIEGFDHGPASRQFNYWLARKMRGNQNADTGSSISDAMQAALQFGLCLESVWPYSEPFTQEPSPAAYADGLKRLPTAKMEVHVHQDLQSLWGTLTDRDGIAFGFNVPAAFMTQKMADTGIMEMPGRFAKYVGGHAVVLVGYDPNTKYFIARNSWGVDWGIKGYFKIPEKFVLSRACSDFIGAVDAPKVA